MEPVLGRLTGQDKDPVSRGRLSKLASSLDMNIQAHMRHKQEEDKEKEEEDQEEKEDQEEEDRRKKTRRATKRKKRIRMRNKRTCLLTFTWFFHSFR